MDWLAAGLAIALLAVLGFSFSSLRFAFFPPQYPPAMVPAAAIKRRRAMAEQTVDSASDARTVNNTMRHQYRILSDEEKARMTAIKDKGAELLALIESCGNSRELSIARTKTEEAVMWAVKHVTA